MYCNREYVESMSKVAIEPYMEGTVNRFFLRNQHLQDLFICAYQ